MSEPIVTSDPYDRASKETETNGGDALLVGICVRGDSGTF